MQNLQKVAGALILGVFAFSCEKEEGVQNRQPVDASARFMQLPSPAANGRLASGQNVALFSAEYITSGESGEIGRTVYFNNVGNKQLTADFVPGLALDGTDDISYHIDETRPSQEVGVSASSAAITRAMNTWDGLTCSQLGLTKVTSTGTSTGWVAKFYEFGGSYNYVADVNHAGWLPAEFFDKIAAGGSKYILGVTFTIQFTDAAGKPVDTDNNGKADVAWREIYYNDAFPWAVGNHYDIETIALHEAGHGLSQQHFGAAFADSGSGQLHFSPRAVMNAAYSGIQTQINQTDNAGHCSNWSAWPLN